MPRSANSPASMLALLPSVDGRVVTPAHSGYDEARQVYYGDVDRRPAAIVRVAGPDDVRRAVHAARDAGLELAVRSGGHSVAGHGTTDGGLVIDVRDLARTEIDADGATAWVGAGATARDVTAALAPHGRAIGFGDAGSVGVGGITLSGGIGFLVRRFGLTIDSLLAAEIVTADGRLRHVDAEREPDLFWAIRGGGGNFGVVTRFRFRLQPLPRFTGGLLVLPATRDAIVGLTDAALAAPDELTVIANVMSAPPLPFLPAEAHGRLVILAHVAFAGGGDAAERAIRPLRTLAAPLADTVAAGPYLGMYPPESHAHRPTVIGRTLFVDGIDDAAAGTILEHLAASDAPVRIAQLRPLGGAAARVPADATAYAHRAQPVLVNVAAFYQGASDREARRAWVTAFARALQPRDAAAYVAFLGDDGPERMRLAYPGATWDRLARIKAAYDPTNLFRLNHNVPPVAPPPAAA